LLNLNGYSGWEHRENGREQEMSIGYRLLICLGILLLHFVALFLPLTELFLIYIILFNPRWFRDFLNNMAKTP